MTIKQAETVLAKAGVSSPELDALVLAEYVSGTDKSTLLAYPERQIEGLEELIAKRAKRVPIAHLVGSKDFYGLELIITPDVLQPRPESETIVDLAIKGAPKDSKLIDIGTGCGALAISIAVNRPDLTVTATDVSSSALKVAQENAKLNDVKIKLVESDLFSKVAGQFETVVANLPYLKNDSDLLPEVKNEPKVALLGGKDGLDLYRKFFEQLPKHLAKAGHVFIESDPWQQPELIKIAGNAGLKLRDQSYFVLGFCLA